MSSSLQLKTGAVYFSVSYTDAALSLPIVRSVVYLGENVDGQSADKHFFQDTGSYASNGAYPSFTVPPKDNDEVEIHRVGEDGLALIFDLADMYSHLKNRI